MEKEKSIKKQELLKCINQKMINVATSKNFTKYASLAIILATTFLGASDGPPSPDPDNGNGGSNNN